jgi:antitoxin CptB
MQHDPTDSDRLKKLKFRAWRRGFREADLILGPFVDAYGRGLSAAELNQLEILLEQPDQALYDWIIGRDAPPAEFNTPLLDRIRAFRFQARGTRTDLGS